MSFKLVMLPPQTEVYRDWGKRLAAALPRCTSSSPKASSRRSTRSSMPTPRSVRCQDLLQRATKLRWLQAHHAAPPAGYYYPELIAHPMVVTNMREIYNDHIGAHIMAFVLAFARGFHRYLPQQLHREWAKSEREDGDVLHLPEATALIVGVGGIGAEAARLAAAFGMTVLATDARRKDGRRGSRNCIHPSGSMRCCRARTSSF